MGLDPNINIIKKEKKMMRGVKFQKYSTNWKSKRKMKNLIEQFYRECKKGKSLVLVKSSTRNGSPTIP